MRAHLNSGQAAVFDEFAAESDDGALTSVSVPIMCSIWSGGFLLWINVALQWLRYIGLDSWQSVGAGWLPVDVSGSQCREQFKSCLIDLWRQQSSELSFNFILVEAELSFNVILGYCLTLRRKNSISSASMKSLKIHTMLTATK